MDVNPHKSVADQATEGGTYERALQLLQWADLLKVCGSYEEDQRKRRERVGLNIFTIVSERYYQENFHSDVLKAFLDRNGAHGNGSLYFGHFLGMLKTSSGGIPIPDVEVFGAYVVERERDHIDVGIRGGNTGGPRPKAIIVENKIHDASDQPDQLPRYYKVCKDKDFDVVAVVYLSLSGNKEPDRSEWISEDRDTIDRKLICIGAFPNGQSPDLLTGWVAPCIAAAEKVKNTDAAVILRQYGELLRYLGADVMNNQVMQDFWNLMRQDEKYQDAMALRKMFDNIPSYLAQKTVEQYKTQCCPFNRMFAWPPGDAPHVAVFDGLKFEGARIAADLDYAEKKAELSMFDRDGHADTVQKLLKRAGLDTYFVLGKERYWLSPAFSLPEQEDDLHRFLKERFLACLRKATGK